MLCDVAQIYGDCTFPVPAINGVVHWYLPTVSTWGGFVCHRAWSLIFRVGGSTRCTCFLWACLRAFAPTARDFSEDLVSVQLVKEDPLPEVSADVTPDQDQDNDGVNQEPSDTESREGYDSECEALNDLGIVWTREKVLVSNAKPDGKGQN